MANRLSRDAILIRALNLIDSPRVDEKDRSGGLNQIDAGAVLSPGWLQDALDLAHNLYPQAGALVTAPITLTVGVATYTISTIAANYILDFKDGIVLDNDKGRLTKRALNKLLDFKTGTSSRGKPINYTVHNFLIVVRPIPDQTYTGTLYYYSLPSVLTSGTVPNFPSDLILVEYVHLRGREWLRELPAGTAEKYLIDAVARLQKAGLGPEAEMDDQIGVDRDYFPGGGTPYQDPGNSWFTQVNA